MKKNLVLYCVIIALSFLWTGSSFISVAYRMLESYTALQVDIYIVVIGYLLQVLGMLLFSLGLRLRPHLFSRKSFSAAVMIADAAAIAAAVLSNSAAISLVCSFVMNLIHGMVAAIYLTYLGRFVPQQYRGRVFGFGYAAGSVGSWLISLPFGGSFLGMDAVIIVYVILTALTILFVSRTGEVFESNDGTVDTKAGFQFKSLAKVFIVLVILSMVKNIGFYFPASDVSGIIDLEFSRSFYAIGLITAGIINDMNRRYGAICCVASLVFSFLSFALMDNPGYSVTLWIIGYIFFGFFSVYRVTAFSDIASEKPSMLAIAAFGLAAGRTGDAVGTALGILLSGKTVMLLIVTSSLFIFVVFLFFSLYHKLYNSPISESVILERKYEAFERKYSLSAREREVFRFVVQGYSNLEISTSLYISESTVKYHVGNIFKKTACSNRTDLAVMFRDS